MEENIGPSGLCNKTQLQNSRKKKAPGIEWQYAINIGDQICRLGVQAMPCN